MMFAAKLRRLALPVFVFGAICTLSTAAQAMCVYNNMDVEIEVTFDCGAFCGNNWTLASGAYSCRPDESGTVLVGPGGVGEGGYLPYPAFIDVDAHGYVVMSTIGANNQRDVCAFHADDSLESCVDFSYP
jgi:hypothetical protein